MSLQTRPIETKKDTLVPDLATLVQTALQELVDQINSFPSLFFTTKAIPANMKDGDLLVTRTGNTITIRVKNATGFDPLTLPDLTALQTQVTTLSTTVTALSATVTALTTTVSGKLDKNGTVFKGLITNTSSGITNFPTSGDWGFQNNSGTLTLKYNVGGTVKSVTLT